jgi:ubiquinone/menaquinone biosynthesis C-methylase UbiE
VNLSIEDWHQRFLQQAEWTRELRSYLYAKAELQNARNLLDVGCGTGALLTELEGNPQLQVFGLDLMASNLRFAQAMSPNTHLVQADALNTPFPQNFFDISLTHFVLLWVADPLQCLKELSRITRPGGSILALAEPDYGARMDYPVELARLGNWQRQALEHQGANPTIGRKLRSLFLQAELKNVECGILGAQWSPGFSESAWLEEWRILAHDLATLKIGLDSRQVEKLRALDRLSRQQETRILFVPTFYAIGRVA